MQINPAKSAVENVVDLINDVNVGLNLTSAQVTMGTPSVISEGALNAQITLTAVEGQGYATGSTKIIKYTRLGVLTGVATPPAKVEVAETDTITEVKTKVVAALGLVAADVAASALTMPVDPETDGQVTVAPIADSKLYVGSGEVIVLNFPLPDLGDAIAVGNLDGFDAVV